MISLPDIDLLSLQSELKHKKEDGLTYLFDPIRRRYIRTNPEELVRQLWIQYFLKVKNIQPKFIAVERLFVAHGHQKRFDLVLFDRTTLPILIAEFKGPGISVDQGVFDQIMVYNLALKIPYSLVSNGTMHYCFEADEEKRQFQYLQSLPF